jgi:hypothetical protein
MTTETSLTTRDARTPDLVGTSLLTQLDPTRRDVLRRQIAPGATDVELEYFLASAEHAGLDPYAIPRQIACFEQREQVDGKWQSRRTPVIMIDGWRKLLSETGRVSGLDVEWCGKDGHWRDSWPDDVKPLAARVCIYIRGEARPVKFVAHYRDFVQYATGGLEPRGTWKKMPTHMLAVRALSHCIKQALMVLGTASDHLQAALGVSYADEDRGEFDDGDSFAVARRRFWARAHDLGLSDAQVHLAMQIPPGGSLDDAMRLDADMRSDGGYNRAIAYLEAWAASSRRNVTLPAIDQPAGTNDLLYPGGDIPTHGPGATEGMGGGPGPGDGGGSTTSVAPVPDPGQTEAADERLVWEREDQTKAAECAMCGEPSTVDGPDGFPLCDACANASVAELTHEPEAYPPMPESVVDYRTFVQATEKVLGANNVKVAEVVGRGIGWNVDRVELLRRWYAVAAVPS